MDEMSATAMALSEETMSVQHADYPHDPGTLYDCPACEGTCHCTDGFVCVRCADQEEVS